MCKQPRSDENRARLRSEIPENFVEIANSIVDSDESLTTFATRTGFLRPLAWITAGCLALLMSLSGLAGDPPKPADNSYCLVCHANFKAEKLSSKHQKGGIGCAKCHGDSDSHSADEDGLTPPEIMFSKDQIAGACVKCHEEPKLREVEEHEPVFAMEIAKRKLCTECHGEHRMAQRTRIWDKATGKLLKAEGVRMMQKDSPATSAR